MKTTILAHLLVAGGAIGLAWPMLSDEGEDIALAKDGSETVSSAAAQPHSVPVSTWSETVTLKRAFDGHFYADVMVDGMRTRMLVDTGATTIALTGDDAAALGIYWDYSQLGIVAQGANGPIEGVRVTLPQVEIDGFVATNVAAIVVPEGLGISLLGQSFLSTVDTVKIADDQMVLSN